MGLGFKMAICPKCKKVINELYQIRTGVESSRFFIDISGVADCDEEEFDGNGDSNEFQCVECWEFLFEDWGEAEDFLKEKDELKELVVEKLEKIKDGK